MRYHERTFVLRVNIYTPDINTKLVEIAEMTHDEEDPIDTEDTQPTEESVSIPEHLSVITGLARAISDKIDDLCKQIEEVHDIVSYDHGTPGYDSDESDPF